MRGLIYRYQRAGAILHLMTRLRLLIVWIWHLPSVDGVYTDNGFPCFWSMIPVLYQGLELPPTKSSLYLVLYQSTPRSSVWPVFYWLIEAINSDQIDQFCSYRVRILLFDFGITCILFNTTRDFELLTELTAEQPVL